MYCSRVCQINDWNKSGGQQHKLFCGKTGEVGHCLEIKPAGEKGMGLFATRDFAKDEMLMAERPILSYDNLYLFSNLRKSEQIAIMNLAPNKGDLNDKFKMNKFGNSGHLYVHMSRVNHDCYGNSSYMHLNHRDDVQILVAKKAIKAGEEITFAYKHLLYNTPAERRQELRQTYGIFCERQCRICSNPTLEKRARELSQAQRSYLTYLRDCCNGTHKIEMDLDHVLELGSKLLKFYDEFEVHASPYIQLLNQLSICCMIRNQEIKKCRKFLDEAMVISLAFTGSDSESAPVQEVKQLQLFLNSKMYTNADAGDMLTHALWEMISVFLAEGTV